MRDAASSYRAKFEAKVRHIEGIRDRMVGPHATTPFCHEAGVKP